MVGDSTQGSLVLVLVGLGALAAPLAASEHLGISVYICDTECTSAHCSVMCNGVFSPSVVSFHTKSCKMFTKIFMLKPGLYFYNR